MMHNEPELRDKYAHLCKGFKQVAGPYRKAEIAWLLAMHAENLYLLTHNTDYLLNWTEHLAYLKAFMDWWEGRLQKMMLDEYAENAPEILAKLEADAAHAASKDHTEAESGPEITAKLAANATRAASKDHTESEDDTIAS